MPNMDHMAELRPREVGVPTNPNKAHKLLVLRLLGLGFWMFRVFHFFSIIKMLLNLIVTHSKRYVNVTSLLTDKIPPPELVYFHFVYKQCSIFVINELKFSFHCSSMFLFESVFISFLHKYGSKPNLFNCWKMMWLVNWKRIIVPLMPFY